MKRPELTKREQSLLKALQLMQGWVIHKVASSYSGMGDSHFSITRDMNIAAKAIMEATGGNEGFEGVDLNNYDESEHYEELNRGYAKDRI